MSSEYTFFIRSFFTYQVSFDWL